MGRESQQGRGQQLVSSQYFHTAQDMSVIPSILYLLSKIFVHQSIKHQILVIFKLPLGYFINLFQ